jgi:hypothetical protein
VTECSICEPTNDGQGAFNKRQPLPLGAGSPARSKAWHAAHARTPRQGTHAAQECEHPDSVSIARGDRRAAWAPCDLELAERAARA